MNKIIKYAFISFGGILVIILSIFIVRNLIILNSYVYSSDIEALESLNSNSFKAYDHTIFKYETDDGEVLIYASESPCNDYTVTLKKKFIHGETRFKICTAETGTFTLLKDDGKYITVSRHLKYTITDGNEDVLEKRIINMNNEPIEYELTLYNANGVSYNRYIYIIDKS